MRPITSSLTWRRYLLGVVIGLMPLVLWLLGYANGANIFCGPSTGCSTVSAPASTMAAVAACLYVVVGVATVVLFGRPQWRFSGYGLLTMVVIDPVVAAIGCSIIASSHH